MVSEFSIQGVARRRLTVVARDDDAAPAAAHDDASADRLRCRWVYDLKHAALTCRWSAPQ
jgi:hypothetical protein